MCNSKILRPYCRDLKENQQLKYLHFNWLLKFHRLNIFYVHIQCFSNVSTANSQYNFREQSNRS